MTRGIEVKLRMMDNYNYFTGQWTHTCVNGYICIFWFPLGVGFCYRDTTATGGESANDAPPLTYVTHRQTHVHIYMCTHTHTQAVWPVFSLDANSTHRHPMSSLDQPPYPPTHQHVHTYALTYTNKQHTSTDLISVCLKPHIFHSSFFLTWKRITQMTSFLLKRTLLNNGFCLTKCWMLHTYRLKIRCGNVIRSYRSWEK